MHKKFLTFALPVVGAAAIVGSAFSAWTFTSDIHGNGTITGTINVTPLSEEIEVTLEYDTFTLVLDQGGVNNLSNHSVGITAYVTDDSGSSIELTGENSTIKATVTWVGYQELLETNNITLTWTATMAATNPSDDSYANNLASWVSYAGTSNASFGSSSTSTSDGKTVTSWEVEVPMDFVYALKPQSIESYNSMVSDLQGKNVSINISVTAALTAKTGA